MLLVNHGGAGDDIFSHRHRLLVGVLSPASDYFNGFVHLVAGLKLWRKRIAIVRSTGGFAEAVANGVERECHERYARRKGVRVRVKFVGRFDSESTPETLFPALKRNRVNALLSAGSYEHDLAVMRAVTESPLNLPVLGCVAAGVKKFRIDLGEAAEGLVGPSQWEDQLQFRPEIGPTPRDFILRMRSARAGSGVRLSCRAGLCRRPRDQACDRNRAKHRGSENPRGVFRSSHHRLFSAIFPSIA